MTQEAPKRRRTEAQVVCFFHPVKQSPQSSNVSRSGSKPPTKNLLEKVSPLERNPKTQPREGFILEERVKKKRKKESILKMKTKVVTKSIV